MKLRSGLAKKDNQKICASYLLDSEKEMFWSTCMSLMENDSTELVIKHAILIVLNLMLQSLNEKDRDSFMKKRLDNDLYNLFITYLLEPMPKLDLPVTNSPHEDSAILLIHIIGLLSLLYSYGEGKRVDSRINTVLENIEKIVRDRKLIIYKVQRIVDNALTHSILLLQDETLAP